MKLIRQLSVLLFVIITVTTFAQTPPSNQRPSSGTARIASFKKQSALIQSSPYKKLQWRNIGPDNISGRCTDVWGIKGNPNIIYATFASGGLWKTEDGGKTWKSIFDKYGTINFGNMAIAPSNNNILYAGTGEANIFRASLPGIGMFKSTDAGKTWQHIGLENTSTISRVVVHPTNPNIVYAAAGGNEWSYNPDRGVYQTTDGGKTWKKILYQDEKTGCNDLRMDPSDPNIIYASMWNRIRKRWSDPVPEDGDHIYKTTDGGKTWKPLTNGLPDTKRTGRVGLAISESNPNVVYAFVDNHESKREVKEGELDPYGRPRDFVAKGVEVYRSNDKGENWNKMSENDDFMERICGTYGWVFGQIRVNPLDENTIYIMGVPMGKSTDGGKTWQPFRPDRNANSERMHGDNHAMWIDPSDTNRIINGNDGGVIITYDGGKTWKNFFKEIPTTQFYNITYDNNKPFNIMGSVQDEGSFMASIKNTYGTKDTTIKQWQDAPGGEGVIHAIDPQNGNVVYTSSFYGRLIKADLSQPDSLWFRDIAPKKTQDEETLRGEWLAYTMISPFDHNTVYHSYQYLYRSVDSGASWERISPDLTYNNKNKMGKTPYAINHQCITAVDESPIASGLLYAGTDDGRVWRSPKEGQDWIEITKGLPDNAHTSRIVASQYKESRLYVTLSDRREDNITPYIFVSENNGKTWKNIASNLPPAAVNVVREDPKNQNVLYCGTDLGIYISKNRGASWQSLQCNLPPTVSVQDLFVHPRDNVLVIATYGRGIWAIDDITTLQK